MFYIVVTTIIGITSTSTPLPRGYSTLAECNAVAERQAMITIPRDDEAIIFTCTKLEGA